MVAVTPSAPVARPRPADTPENLVAPEQLGRVVNLEENKRLYDPALVQLVIDHMLLADEVGYEAYKALRPLRNEGREMLTKALDEGIEAVEDAPAELVRFFEVLDTVPDWVDFDQLDRGAIAMWRAGRFVPIALAYCSIGYGFSSYGGTKAMNFTRLFIEEERAGGRMTETLRWVAAVSTPGGMRRYGQGFKYSVRVRQVHCAVRFGISKSPKWQWNEWGMPVTNTDLLLTTGRAFCENVVDAVEKLGIRYSNQEKDDIYALWRYIGHVMGCPEELNFTDRFDARVRNKVAEAVEHEPDEANRVLLHSLIGYNAKYTEGYQPIPRVLMERLTPKQKLTMTYGLLRYLNGDKFCESMHVPDSRFKHVARVGSRLVAAKELIAARVKDDRSAAAWKTLREIEKALGVVEVDKAFASPNEIQTAVVRHEPEIDHTLKRPVKL